MTTIKYNFVTINNDDDNDNLNNCSKHVLIGTNIYHHQ